MIDFCNSEWPIFYELLVTTKNTIHCTTLKNNYGGCGSFSALFTRIFIMPKVNVMLNWNLIFKMCASLKMIYIVGVLHVRGLSVNTFKSLCSSWFKFWRILSIIHQLRTSRSTNRRRWLYELTIVIIIFRRFNIYLDN